LAVAVPLARAR